MEWLSEATTEEDRRLDALADLGAAADAATDADQLLDQAVARARRAGVPWADIERTTGMARQPARRRWSGFAGGISPEGGVEQQATAIG